MRILPPGRCPLCGRKGCLIGHGWYCRKGLWDGCARPESFWIKRFLCKVTGRTVSVHPRFVHARKRFRLSTVVSCVAGVISRGESIRDTARACGVSRRSVRRWVRGLGTDEAAKRLCFFPSGFPPPHLSLPAALVALFAEIDPRGLAAGAAEAMPRLQHAYECPLY